MSEPVLTFSDLTLGYNSHPAVHHLSGKIGAGSLTAVAGANGSGKSTLLKGIVGILKPMSGGVSVTAGKRIAYLPQQSEIDRSFPARVVDIVSLGLWPKRGLLGRHTAEDRKRVSDAIAAVGLAGFDNRPIDTLSGGQMQRALFARVLLQDADVILLDEPFNAVDARTTRDLVVMIEGWAAQGRAVMVVLHDLELAKRHFPLTLLLARRPVAWGPTDSVLTSDNLSAAHGFDEAWKDDAPWCAADDDHSHDEDGHNHGDHFHHDHDHKHGKHAHV